MDIYATSIHNKPEETERYRRRIVFRGEIRFIPDLCREFGIPYWLAIERLDKLGWNPEAVFTRPRRKYVRRQSA